MARIFDLSLPIDDAAPEPFPVKIERIGHAEGGDRVGARFSGKGKLDRNSFPDGMFLSHESVMASVHCGTHVDAPYHFGPESEGAPAKKIDELPLDWCYGDAFVLDMTHNSPGDEITAEDVKAGLAHIGYDIKTGDIALMHTGADRYYGTQEYFTKFPGVGTGAIDFLMDKGVKVIGIDAAGIDRPFGMMVDDYFGTGDNKHLWPSHIFGRRREYCHIERLANLGSLPRPYGFKFACFPVKIKNAGAAWARAVAIFEE